MKKAILVLTIFSSSLMADVICQYESYMTTKGDRVICTDESYNKAWIVHPDYESLKLSRLKYIREMIEKGFYMSPADSNIFIKHTGSIGSESTTMPK